MAIQDTVIPRITQVDGKYIIKNDADLITFGLTPLINDAETQINIIELQANASITPFDHDTYVVDTFSDANGYEDTVNTVSSTAIFDTNKYVASSPSGTTEIYTDTHASLLNKNNIKTTCVASSAGYVKKVGWGVTNQSTDVTISILDASDNVLATKTVAGSTADAENKGYTTFSTSDYSSLLSAGQTFKIEYSDSNNRDAFYKENQTFSGTNFSFISQDVLTNRDDVTFNQTGDIIEFETLGSATVVIDMPPLTGTVSDVMLVSNPEPESFNITDGSTTLTNEDVEKKIAWTGSSNPDSVTINLSPGTSINSYALKFWKV